MAVLVEADFLNLLEGSEKVEIVMRSGHRYVVEKGHISVVDSGVQIEDAKLIEPGGAVERDGVNAILVLDSIAEVIGTPPSRRETGHAGKRPRTITDESAAVLDKLLADKGMNRSKLAELLGRHRSATTEIFKGRRRWNLATMRKVAGQLDISLDDLDEILRNPRRWKSRPPKKS